MMTSRRTVPPSGEGSEAERGGMSPRTLRLRRKWTGGGGSRGGMTACRRGLWERTAGEDFRFLRCVDVVCSS